MFSIKGQIGNILLLPAACSLSQLLSFGVVPCRQPKLYGSRQVWLCSSETLITGGGGFALWVAVCQTCLIWSLASGG